MTDLWPDDLTSETLIAPVTMLREQGVLLGQKTSNILIGEVEAIDKGYISYFAYGFYLRSTALNYSFRLFIIQHPIELYPVLFDLDSDLAEELLKTSTTRISAANQEEFINTLGKILSAERTKRVVRAILAQSRGLPQPTMGDNPAY